MLFALGGSLNLIAEIVCLEFQSTTNENNSKIFTVIYNQKFELNYFTKNIAILVILGLNFLQIYLDML